MSASPNLVFQAVDRERWGDFEALFEAKGGPSYCWCVAYRPRPPNASSAERKAVMRQLVADRTPIGILGYLDDEAVAWCSIAPRDTYRSLGGPPAADDERVWSLVCMFIRRDLRRKGVAHQLIAGAVAEARQRGATVVEAYPVDPDSPSYRFMGFVGAYEAAGFKHVGDVGTRRHVMRRDLAR